MEPQGSSQHSKMPATCPYSDSDQSSSRPPYYISGRYILLLFSFLRLGLPRSSLFSPPICTEYYNLLWVLWDWIASFREKAVLQDPLSSQIEQLRYWLLVGPRLLSCGGVGANWLSALLYLYNCRQQVDNLSTYKNEYEYHLHNFNVKMFADNQVICLSQRVIYKEWYRPLLYTRRHKFWHENFFLDYLIVKMKAIQSPETSGTLSPKTRRRIPEDLDL